MLTKILLSDLRNFRKLYEVDFPKHLVTLGLFDHFIDRFQKFPEWENKVQFLSLKHSDFRDGTFAFINGPHIYFDTLASLPFASKPNEKLSELVNQLDYSEEKAFIGVRDDFRPFLEDLLRVQHLEKTFDTGTKCVFGLNLVKDKDIKKHEKDLISKIPEGFYHDSLSENSAEFINSVWISRYPQSLEFLKACIKMNPSTGIYKNDGELIAWAVTQESGAQGTLQVIDEYKGQQLATIASWLQYLKVVKSGKFAYTHVLHYNDESFNIFVNKMGAKWIGNNTWMGVKKKPKCKSYFLWGRQ